VNRNLHFDYTTIGHVTIDVLEDRSRQVGGTAFYSALQAARLGLRALILTQGVPAEIEEMLEPYSGELQLKVLPALETTTLQTVGSGPARSQRVLAWAGPVVQRLRVETSILHLAPVARETPARWHGPAAFVGLTPQGLVRDWPEQGGEIRQLAHVDGGELAGECDAIVMSQHERASCARLIDGALAASAVVAVTAEARPTTILMPGGETVALGVPPVVDPADDLGAGDVFAAAFFVALADGQAAPEAARLANAAAAVRMQGSGPGAIGERAAIEARLHATAASAG
jgi:hypothetical protein